MTHIVRGSVEKQPEATLVRVTIAAALALGVLLAPRLVCGAPKATVTLAESATVAGPRVTLGALTRIDAADPNLSKQLDDVLVGLAPLPGQSRFVERGEIEEALGVAGIAPWDVALVGAPRIEITRIAQVVSEAQLTRAARRALARELAIPESELSFRRLQFSTTPLVGGGALDIDAEFVDEPRLGIPLRATIVVLVGGVPAAQVNAELEVVRSAPEVPPPRREARRRRKERVIRSGEQVTIALEGPGLQITAVGRARNSGALGEEITVENVISGIVVRGIVMGEGRVQIHWSPVTGLQGVRQR